MKTFAAALALLLFTSPALAATTWSFPSTSVRSSKAACTTGSEAAPAVSYAGISTAGIRGLSIHAEAAGAMTAGGKLLAYGLNPVTGNWNRIPSQDIVVTALQYEAYSGIEIVAGVSRIAWVPSGVGVAVDIYIFGS